jgi:cysteine-rich repeat protein
VVLFGGAGGDDTTWAWDGVDWSILSTAQRPPGANGVALAFHGAAGHTVLAGNSADTWVLEGDGWHNRGPAGAPGAVTGALAYDVARRVVVLATNNAVWEWDGASWRVIANAGPNVENGNDGAIAYHTARGRVMIYGGDPGGGGNYPQSNEIWEWNGAVFTAPVFASTLAPSTATPSYECGAALAFSEVEGKVIVLTGAAGNDTWLWNGDSWEHPVSPAAPAVSATGDGEQELAYHRALDQVILWGGAGQNETWSWGAWGAGTCGAAARCWRLVVAAGAGPAARERPSLSYDRRRKRVVMFGGHDPAGATNATSFYRETWEYGDWGTLCAGPCWRLASSGGPPGRSEGGMAYDELRGLTVLYGGTRNWGSSNSGTDCASPTGAHDCADTWTWDGFAWTELTGASQLQARRGQAMAYDAGRGRVVVYGGRRSGQAFSGAPPIYRDMWELDGSTWVRLQADGAGDNEDEGATCLAFDRARGALLSVDADPTIALWDWRSSGGRATLSMAFNVGRSGVPRTDITGAALRVDATSQSGAAQLTGAAAGGFDLHAWDTGVGAWASLGGAADNTTTGTTVAIPASLARRLPSFDGTARIRIDARYAAGRSTGTLDVDYAELRVDYRLGATPVCGDGALDSGEACDDGNTTAGGNGCGADCRRVGSCGDGARQASFEECDDGAGNSDAAPDACRTTCVLARCGDGVVDAGEACDDGDTLDSGDGCSAECGINSICGDGVVERGEQCDDGGAPAADRGCLDSCQRDACCTARAVGGGCAPGGSAAIQACVCGRRAACCVTRWDAACAADVERYGCGVCAW